MPIYLFTIALLCAGLVACDSKSDAPNPAPTSDAGEVSVDTGAGVDAAADSGGPAVPEEEVYTGPLPNSPLVAAVSPDEAIAAAGETSYGTISGPIFGKNSDVLGMIRTSCGDGTVLKPIFRRSGESKAEVGTAIPLQFYNVATKRPVTYDEGDFRVTVDFSEDSEKRLAGSIHITFEELGETKTYAKLSYDGPTLRPMTPPKMTGEGNLVAYPKCYPTGFYRLEETDGTVTTGLMRVVETDGAAIAQVMVGEESSFQILVAGRDRKKGINPPQKVAIEEARRTAGDVGVLFDVLHRPELIEPEEAIGANLGTQQQSKITEGVATVGISRRKGDLYLDATFERFRVSSILDGPLSGREFKKLQVYGKMVESTETSVGQIEPPEWYNGE